MYISHTVHVFRWDHGDVIKWVHFPRNWPFVRGIHRSPVNSPHKGQWRGALMFSLICVWINDCVNNREAGDLRRRCAHYDVIVMECTYPIHSMFCVGTVKRTGIIAWIINHINTFVLDEITHPCPIFNDDLIKPSLKLNGWVITCSVYVDVITHPCSDPPAKLPNLCY